MRPARSTLPVVAAVGVSAPFNLGAVARKIERGFSRIYQWYLLRSLRRDVARKMEALGDDLGLTRRELRRLNTFFKFDDRISGPWNGFGGAEDYYARTRSDLLLKHVAVPTLILNAHNDPLVPARLIPHAARCFRQGDAGDYRRRRPSGIRLRPVALVAAILAGHASTGVSVAALLRLLFRYRPVGLDPVEMRLGAQGQRAFPETAGDAMQPVSKVLTASNSQVRPGLITVTFPS